MDQRDAALEIVATGLRFPEGPIAMPDGSVIVVEIMGRALTRVHPDGSLQVIAELEGGPNGAALGPDGWCYVCNSGGWIYTREGDLHRPIGQDERPGWIERVHLETGRVERLYQDTASRTLRSPNDMVFDDHGGFWFTDLGSRRERALEIGGVFYARADGSGITEVLPSMVTANGIGLSPDGGTLYVAETLPRRLWAFEIVAPGELCLTGHFINGGRLVAGLPGLNNPDSLAVDADGHVCLATIIDGAIWDIPVDGGEPVRCPMPDIYSTNICFGGPELRDAYVTLSASGRLARLRWPRPGHPLAYLNRHPSGVPLP